MMVVVLVVMVVVVVAVMVEVVMGVVSSGKPSLPPVSQCPRRLRSRLGEGQGAQGGREAPESGPITGSAVVILYFLHVCSSPNIRESIKVASGGPRNITRRCATFRGCRPLCSRPISASVGPFRDKNVKQTRTYFSCLMTPQLRGGPHG